MLANKETCSEAILLYPQSAVETAYRNRYADRAPAELFGFSRTRIAVFAGTPNMLALSECSTRSLFMKVADVCLLLVGEGPYNSPITEFLPVTTSFVVAKGW